MKFAYSAALIKPRHDLINPRFLVALMNNPLVKRQADKRIKGIGVPDLHLEEIRDFDIPLPPLSLQRRFSDFVQMVGRQRESVRAAITESENLFASLSQRAFRGEL